MRESPLIIAVAPNGARKTRLDHPALPITPDELAIEAEHCLAAGAAMIHLHVRDRHNAHSLDVARYRAATAAIRARVGGEMIIQVTTEAVGRYHPDQQMAMVRELHPEAVSLAIRELCPDTEAQEQAALFFTWLENEHIAPQYILYSPEDVLRFESLREQGIIPGECLSVLYVLGRHRENEGAPHAQLQAMIAANQRNLVWSVCAFGAAEAVVMELAISLGGHCRVGFENNTLLVSGDSAPNNAALVAQVVAEAAKQGRRIASPAEARNLWGMP